MDSKLPIILPFAELELVDEHIIFIKITRNMEMSEEMAHQLKSAVESLSQQKPHAVLYDLNHYHVLLTNIAKSMAGTRNFTKDGLFARALIVYSLDNKLEINHFLKRFNPETPTEIFSNIPEAREWIRKLREKLNLSGD